MPNRVLREGILTSERINLLSWEAEVFYRRLMSVVDDFGRFSAHPSLLRAALYPLKLDTVRDANMERLLAAVEQACLVRVYVVDGKRYLEMHDFKQQIRAKQSKYPDPPSLDERTHSMCVADEKQLQSSAHLGEVGGEVEDEDEVGGEVGGGGGIEKCPATLTIQKPLDADEFRMHSQWRPSAHIATLAKQAGLAMPESRSFAAALGEFIAYWMTQPMARNQHRWDHAFIKSLKAEKVRGFSGRSKPTVAEQNDAAFEEARRMIFGEESTHD